MMYQFLVHRALATGIAPNLGPPYRLTLWRPTIWSPIPPGPMGGALPVWWMFHMLGVFANQDYAAIIVFRDAMPVHRSCVFPRYFRFPFMSAADLQIGDTWTCPSERGRGLATLALKAVVECCSQPGRALWYLADDQNKPSIRVAEKAGFTAAGRGHRTSPFGLRVFGQYVLTDRAS